MRKIVIGMLMIIGGWFFSVATAEEPAEQFLEALRNEGYFDIARDYLDSLEKSDLATDDFRKVLPFEKAETLVAIAKTLKDPKAAEARLNEAQQILTEFGGRDQSLETQARTARYQGNLYYSRAKVNELLGSSDRLIASEKEVFAHQSREMLKSSLDSYQQARAKVRELIDPDSPNGLKIDPQDLSTTTRLKQFQALYTQIRIRLPLVIEQLADTYPENDPERIKLLGEAVNEYNNVYEDYFKYAAGLDARLFAARCRQKLGQHPEALMLLEDIFNFNDSSALRNLKRSAFLIACDSWSKLDTYPAAEVISRLDPIVAVLNREEVRQADWLRIQLELAVAKHQQAIDVKAAGGPKSGTEADTLDRQSAKLLRALSRLPGEHRDRAKELISQWNISINEVTDAEPATPATFVDARQKARDIVLEIEPLIGQANQLKQQLTAAPEDQKSVLTSDLNDVATQIDELSTTAMDMLDLALSLTDDTTLRADINNVRYLQCFCYFARQQYFESALIGGFLLDKYPTIDGTRNAMALMIQSYAQLLDQADESDKSYELNRLTNACTAVVERWPGSSEAGLAASTLIRLAISNKDFPTAEKYFSQLPQDFPSRSALASRLGQRMWFDYRAKTPVTEDQRAALQQQLTQTKTYLEWGAREATIKNLDYETALGCLLLVDAHLEAGEVEKAVQRLENSEIAPLDLVKLKHPAIVQSRLAELFNRETYKIAIKTYLAAMRNSDNPQLWIDKANGVIAAMRQDMDHSDDPQARQRVTQIYGLIATELLAQFEALKSLDEKNKFAESLLSFLSSIEKDSQDSRIILWAGSTLLNVANSLTALGQIDNAKPLFQQAVSALNRAESLGFAGDPQQAAMTSELQRQRALAQRGSGNYEAAVEQFVTILGKNAKNLNVQMDAAETLQAWGKSSGRSKLYAEAMMGSHPATDPKTKRQSNLIWGWRQLSQATRGNEKYADAFYQSLYRLAESRLEYGLLEKNEEAVTSALREIENAEQRDAEMGGANWKQKFSELKNRIKQNMN